ncbi:MAG: putative surface protein with fasciclin (FAS1) repeats [Planctomycetota bacterium]|jgi:uncharacterized surface protein with fasciclin (FAS1) repeats|uniref:fasciclin domain-containing protein n=1 Tax=Patiriisocius sp. Uisw_047 TaxID=3230969 RepID=UPI0039E838E7
MRYNWSLLVIVMVIGFSSCDERPSKQNAQVIGAQDSKNVKPEPPIVLPYNLASRIRSSDDLTLLFAEIESSPILDQLTTDKGPFTIFAPSDEALEEIDYLGDRMVIEDLLKKYMVKGKITTVALTKKIRTNGGSYSMKTLGGTTLVAYKLGNIIFLKNLKGDKAEIGKSDIVASNGIIHVVKSPLDI